MTYMHPKNILIYHLIKLSVSCIFQKSQFYIISKVSVSLSRLGNYDIFQDSALFWILSLIAIDKYDGNKLSG